MVSDGVNTRMINSMIVISIIISIIIIISRVLWSLVGKMGRKEAAFGRLLHACTICNPIIIVVVVNIIIIIIIIIILIIIIIIKLHVQRLLPLNSSKIWNHSGNPNSAP